MFECKKNTVQSDTNVENECGQVHESRNVRLANLLKALLESNYFYDTFDVEEQISLLSVSDSNKLSENLKKCLKNMSDNVYHPSVEKLLTENEKLVLPAEVYNNDVSPIVALDNVKADEWSAKQNNKNSERIAPKNSIAKNRSADSVRLRKRIIIYDSESEGELPKPGRKIATTEFTSDDAWNDTSSENSCDSTDAEVQMRLSAEPLLEIENKSKSMKTDSEIICLTDDDDDDDLKSGDLELKLLFQKYYKIDLKPKIVALYFTQKGSTCLRNMLCELKKHSIPIEFKNADSYYVQFIKKKSNVKKCSGDMTFWSYEDCIDIDNGVEPTTDAGNALKMFNRDGSPESVASPSSECSVIPETVVNNNSVLSEISLLKKLLTRGGTAQISDAIEIEKIEDEMISKPTHITNTEKIENVESTNANAAIMGTTEHNTNDQSQDSFETVLQTTNNQTETLSLTKKQRGKRKTSFIPNTKPKKGKKVANADDDNAKHTVQSTLDTTVKSQDSLTPENEVQSSVNDTIVKKKKASRKPRISIMQPLIERLNSKNSKKCTNKDESGLSEINQFQSEGIGFPEGNKTNAEKARVANANPIVQMAQSQTSTTSEIAPETNINDMLVNKAILICKNRIPKISMLQQVNLNTNAQLTSEQDQECTNTDEPNSFVVNQYQAKTVRDAVNSGSANAVPHAKKLNTNSITNEGVVQTMGVDTSEDVQLCTNTKEPNLPRANQPKTVIVLSANTSGPKKPSDANTASQSQNSPAEKQTTINEVNIPTLNPQIIAITTNNNSRISILKPIHSLASENVQNTSTVQYGSATIPQPIVLSTVVNKTSSNATATSVAKMNNKAASKSENLIMQSTMPNSIAQPLTFADRTQSANIPMVDRGMFVKGTLKSGTFIVNANGKTGNPIKEPIRLKIVSATKNVTCSSSTITSGALASSCFNQDETHKPSDPNVTDSQKAKNTANLPTFDTSGKSEIQTVIDPFFQANEAALQNSTICTHDFAVTNNNTTTTYCNNNVYFADDSMSPLLPLFTNAPQRAVLTPIGTNTGNPQFYSVNGLIASNVVRTVPTILKRSVSVLPKPTTNLCNPPTGLWYLLPAALPLHTENENVVTLQPNLAVRTIQPMPQAQKSKASRGRIKKNNLWDRPL